MSPGTPCHRGTVRRASVDLVAAYLAEIPRDEPAPLAVEVRMQTPLVDPFTGEDLGIPLLGVVDLVLATDEGPVIVDFKTSRSMKTEEDILSYFVQAATYAYMYEEIYGLTIEKICIIMLVQHDPTPLVFIKDPRDYYDLVNEVFKLVWLY